MIRSPRRGFLDLEKALILFLVVMVFGAVVASYRIWTNDRPDADPADSWLSACQGCLEQLNLDIKFSRLVALSSTTLRLENVQGREVTIAFAGDLLERTEGTGGKKVLLSNIEQGWFSPHPRIPGLVSVVILARDQKTLPFFTSFFPRHGIATQETTEP